MSPDSSPLSFAPALVEGLLRPLFATDSARAARAAALLGAPLALAAIEAVGEGCALDAEGVRRAAQLRAVEAKAERVELLEFCAALHDAGFRFVAIKGLATSLDLYPRPYYRLVPDIDLLFRATDIERLVGFLAARDFATRLEPGTVRRWGALTKASFAPAAPEDGAVYLDVHIALDDLPASRGLSAARVFEAARAPAQGPDWLRIPSDDHAFAILALHAFRDLYEPRGLKSLIDAALLVARDGLDTAALEALAREGRFTRRLVFYRELLAELGAAPRLPLFAAQPLSARRARLLAGIAANFRTLERFSVPDSTKLALEFALYDSPLTAVQRNLRRLGGLVRPPLHLLPGLPVASEAVDGEAG